MVMITTKATWLGDFALSVWQHCKVLWRVDRGIVLSLVSCWVLVMTYDFRFSSLHSAQVEFSH